MKAFVAFVVLLILVAGGGLGYLGWEKWTKIEQRGVGLKLSNPVSEEQKEMMESQYNELLDREDVLRNTVETHGLAKYYGVSSSEEALDLFRKDSSISLPGGNDLHVLFRGKRSTRPEREAATRTLAEDFVKAAKLAGGNG